MRDILEQSELAGLTLLGAPQLFGMDFMLTDTWEPYLLEMNTTVGSTASGALLLSSSPLQPEFTVHPQAQSYCEVVKRKVFIDTMTAEFYPGRLPGFQVR